MIIIFAAEFNIDKMSENKRKSTDHKEEQKSIDIVGDLRQFIEKNRIQNEALKKIVDEFNSIEINKKNK